MIPSYDPQDDLLTLEHLQCVEADEREDDIMEVVERLKETEMYVEWDEDCLLWCVFTANGKCVATFATKCDAEEYLDSALACKCPDSPCPVHTGTYRYDKAKPFGKGHKRKYD